MLSSTYDLKSTDTKHVAGNYISSYSLSVKSPGELIKANLISFQNQAVILFSRFCPIVARSYVMDSIRWRFLIKRNLQSKPTIVELQHCDCLLFIYFIVFLRRFQLTNTIICLRQKRIILHNCK